MKKTLENKYFAVFIIFSFLVYIMSNGEWCIPIFAWIYPILFLCMIYLNPTRKVCLIISSIYATGFIVQFWRAIGMDIKICIIVAILLSFLKVLPYIYWSKSKMRFQNTIIFASIMVSIEYIIYLIYPILGGLSDAYTQYQNLYLLQLVTVTGIYGITFLMYWTAAVVIWIWNNKNQKEYIRKYIIVYGSVIGLVFVYGVVMFHFAGNSDKSIRIAGVTVPISELLNNDEDVYSTFYTNTFTDENITNARSKLSSAADELFLKTELEAQAGAKDCLLV